MLAAKNITEPTKEVRLTNFVSSSPEVLNSFIDDIGNSIDEFQQGLEKIQIDYFADQNSLEDWPLNQLASKCTNTKELRIEDLEETTEGNCKQIIDFVVQVCTNSVHSLQTLHLENMKS